MHTSPLVDALDDIDLANTTRGGIHSAVEAAAQIIHEHVEAAHTGHPAPVIPITTETRSAA